MSAKLELDDIEFAFLFEEDESVAPEDITPVEN